MHLTISKEYRSSDGSSKFLFQARDLSMLEAMYMPGDTKCKICVSSQVGCSFECNHCATGLIDFKRNLSGKEIAGQVKLILSRFNNDLKPEILYYGVGEPFVNADSVFESIEIIRDEIPLIRDYGQFYIATSGIPGAIKKFGELDSGVNLTISLHVANQEKRANLIPQSVRYTIYDLRRDLITYQKMTQRKITFHYCLMKDFNDGEEDIRNLEEYVLGIDCEIHIIPFNSFIEACYEAPSLEKIMWFVRILKNRGLDVCYKPSRGRDVLGACGQLLAKHSTVMTVDKESCHGQKE